MFFKNLMSVFKVTFEVSILGSHFLRFIKFENLIEGVH